MARKNGTSQSSGNGHSVSEDIASIEREIGQLIAAARGGSASALGQLLEGCRKYLLLVANESLDSDLRPKGGASDLVQETFVQAQRIFERFVRFGHAE